MDRVKIIEFEMESLRSRKKKIRIFLPRNYEGSDKSYPVLYMHDGQNLIGKDNPSNHSWEVLKTMDESSENIGDMIIVGIDNDQQKRILEYTPHISKKLGRYLLANTQIQKNEIEAEADQYGEFIIQQVIPYVNQNYRTLKDRDHTFIAGSSCGGIISIYLGIKYHDHFSVIGAFSPAYWVVKKYLFDYLEKSTLNQDLYVYHDMGGKENGLRSRAYITDMNLFDDLLLTKIDRSHVLKVLDADAIHNEYHWALRFPRFYEFCLKHQD